MTNLVRVKLGDTEIWMEPEENVVVEREPQRVSAEDTAEKAMKVAEDIHDTIKAYCASLVRAFESIEVRKPNRFTAEFGIKLSADCKAYVVNAGTEASLKITAEWVRENDTRDR
jgi:hypothetical protein